MAMKSEVELYRQYFGDDSYMARTRLASKFSSLERIASNGDVELVDIPACRVMLNEIFDYFVLRQRFIHLSDQAMGHLSFAIDGFKLYETTFQTLDEVEKALKNKAFL